MSKQLIRDRIREQRRRLSPRQQRLAADNLSRRLHAQLFFQRARVVAFYLANDGEIDPTPLMGRALKAGKTVCLPVLDPHRPGHLVFVPWKPGGRLQPNRFGIPEPPLLGATRIRWWQLDVVFMPLVGFDRFGNRLGMGGGFYDRTLGPYRQRARPLLIGLAHHFQQVAAVEADNWDVPLDGAATDRAFTFFHHRRG